MNTAMLRTFQVGVALLVFTIATMVVLLLVDVVDQQEAVRIGTNVAAIIGIGLVASLALMAVFSLRSGSKPDE